MRVDSHSPAQPVPVLDDRELYLGDNGRCFCGRHAGASARFTGRDLSGQRVYRVTANDQEWYREELGHPIACESCGGER